MEEFEEALRGKIIVLVGFSGVGKSLFINRFCFGSVLVGVFESVEFLLVFSERGDGDSSDVKYIIDMDIEGGGGGGIKCGSCLIEDEKWCSDLLNLDL